MPTHSAANAQWRIYIGPHWAAEDDATFFDWTLYEADGTNDLDWETTLTSTLASGATSAALDDGLQFTQTGGAWIGPNGAGQAWEYCPYTAKSGADTLTGLVRETTADREHNGVHTAGATVRQFWPVETNDGRLHLVEETDDTFSSVVWYAEISGVLAPQAALRNNHLIIVQYRSSPSGTFANLLVGWIDSPRIKDDGKREARWSCRIISTAQMVNRTQIPGVRLGDLDVAPYGAASGSTALFRAYKEWHSDDFTAANPSFEAGNAVDGDMETLYISEQYIGTQQYDVPENSADPGRIGTANSDDDAYFGPIISQVYLSRPVGEDSVGYRWIELICQSEDVPDLLLMTEQAGSGVAEYIDMAPNDEEYKEGDKIIICEDADLFMQEWPLTTARVFELANDIFGSLKAGGDTIAILTATTVSPSGDQRWCHGVSWGTANGAIDPGNPWELDPDYPGDWAWQGTSNVAAPGPGQVLRYDFNGVSTDSVDYWSLTYDATPGYVVADFTTEDDEDYDGNGRGTGNNNFGQLSPVYMTVSVPPLGLTLKDDITAGDPGVGEYLYMVDASGAGSVAGLVAPLTVQIGDEQITLSSLGDSYGVVSARGANSTSAEGHDAGDEVRIVETYGSSSIATTSPKVKSIGWTLPSGISCYPVDFRLYISGRDQPRTPGSDNWTRDWTLQATVTGHASNTYAYAFSPSKRVRHFMFIFDSMSADPARVRIAEFNVLLDDTYYPADQWLNDGETAGECIAHLLSLAGIPDVVTDTTTLTPTGFTTASDRAWAIVADFAEYTGSKVVVERDGTVTTAPEGVYAVGGYTPAETWTRITASAVEKLWTRDATGVRQVRLEWRTPDDETICTEYYPDDADAPADGAVLDVGPLIYPDAATAATAARRIYFINRYPYILLVECADAEPTVRPLQIHRLTWQFDTEMQQIDRYYVVQSADHMIDRGVWQTVLTLRQINRESEG